MGFPVKLTDAAAVKAWSLLVANGREDMKLRLSVQPGGCSGLIYNLSFDDRDLENDASEVFGELEVVIDRMSVPFLEGATVDYTDTIEKQGFSIENPNASGTCACGDSFH